MGTAKRPWKKMREHMKYPIENLPDAKANIDKETCPENHVALMRKFEVRDLTIEKYRQYKKPRQASQ